MFVICSFRAQVEAGRVRHADAEARTAPSGPSGHLPHWGEDTRNPCHPGSAAGAIRDGTGYLVPPPGQPAGLSREQGGCRAGS